MRWRLVWPAPSPIPSAVTPPLPLLQRKTKKGQEASWMVEPSTRKRTMSLVTQSAVPTIPQRSSEPKPSRLVQWVRAVAEARTRMYLEAVTNPATGRIDPALEKQVLRMMAL